MTSSIISLLINMLVLVPTMAKVTSPQQGRQSELGAESAAAFIKLLSHCLCQDSALWSHKAFLIEGF